MAMFESNMSMCDGLTLEQIQIHVMMILLLCLLVDARQANWITAKATIAHLYCYLSNTA